MSTHTQSSELLKNLIFHLHGLDGAAVTITVTKLVSAEGLSSIVAYSHD